MEVTLEGTQLDETKLYERLCADIRATDEISFKLLGLVPLVSGTALITVVLGDPPLDESLVVVLALFAAAITFGVFRWELRNLQTCRWLIRCAEYIEEEALGRQDSPNRLPLQPKPPQGLSKRHAEKWIYAVTIATWLGLPRFILDDLREWSLTHAVFSILLGGLTVWSLFADVEVPRKEKPRPNGAAV